MTLLKINVITSLKNKQMKVFVKLPTGEKIACTVDGNNEIRKIKEVIIDQTGMTPEQIRLIFEGILLNDDSTFDSSGINDGATISMTVSLTA